LYAVPGKERGLRLRRMTTAIAIFENPAMALENGYLERA
jgi:hypothetical protein